MREAVASDWALGAALALTLVLHTLIRAFARRVPGRPILPDWMTKNRVLPPWLATPIQERDWPFFLWADLVYLLLLFGGMTLYAADDDRNGVRAWIPDILGGIVPIGVPLSGALGGIAISLYGIFRHNHRWKKRFNPWHLFRPYMGALLGSFGFLMFVATVQATGNDVDLDVSPAPSPTTRTTLSTPSANALPDSTTAASGGPLTTLSVASTTTTTTTVATSAVTEDEENSATDQSQLIFYYIIAFVIGFREETFRELIKRTADLILKPQGTGGATASLRALPQSGSAPLTVVFDLTGSKKADEMSLEFGDGERYTKASSMSPGSLQHTYKEARRYISTLTVSDENGDEHQASVEIDVTAGESPSTPIGGRQGQALVALDGQMTPRGPTSSDQGVQQIEAATSDYERRSIERRLIEETNKVPEEGGAGAEEP